MDWNVEFNQEMEMALKARAKGKEGQARVCARRAAGVVLRAYLDKSGLPVRSPSAYDLLQYFLTLANQPAEARSAAEYLVLRVNESFVLPENIDLLEQALTLARILLPAEPQH